jgi:hypothetical protein
MKQVIRFINEAMGSGATPAQIHTNISKALKSAGFKVKKFQKMTHGYGGVWGGFYTVSDGMVLPFHVKKDGKVSYDAGPKDWIIGNIDYASVLQSELKKIKKMDSYGQDTISKVKRTKKIASEGFSSSLVKKAIGIAKKMSGNMTGAVKLIDKIKRGLSDDPKVSAALQAANESVNEGTRFRVRKSDAKAVTKLILRNGWSAEKANMGRDVKFDIEGNDKEIMNTLAKHGIIISHLDEAVVATMRTSSGTRTLEKKGKKLTMKMPNGEVLDFKDGADVKEYMDRVYGYWSFIKGYGKVKGLRESTAAYEKALQKIAKDKQLSMLSKNDRETLLKVAKLMKSANENKKIDEKVAMPLGDHLTAATKELDYMIKVGPIEDAYDSPKVSLKVIKMARKLLDKVN